MWAIKREHSSTRLIIGDWWVTEKGTGYPGTKMVIFYPFARERTRERHLHQIWQSCIGRSLTVICNFLVMCWGVWILWGGGRSLPFSIDRPQLPLIQGSCYTAQCVVVSNILGKRCVRVTLTPTRERQRWHASATKWAWIQVSLLTLLPNTDTCY